MIQKVKTCLEHEPHILGIPTDINKAAMDEYVSLIDARMNFTVAPASEIDSDRSGAVAFTWLDLAGEDEDSYLFVVEGVVKEEIVTFEQIMYRCMWERENNRDFKDGSNLSELEGYK